MLRIILSQLYSLKINTMKIILVISLLSIVMAGFVQQSKIESELGAAVHNYIEDFYEGVQ